MRTTAAFALAAANLAAAHTTFQSFVIGGKDQGQHFAVRTPSNGNNPILDVTSTAMNCNGGVATADQVEAAAGSSITMQWHHNDPATTSGDADEPIAASHKGPIMVYISKAEANGEGAVWTKIYEDGLSGGKWAVEKFISDKGAITIDLPNLEAGDYLIRPEIIALHEGNRDKGAQFYNGCGQLKITGSGSASLPATGTDMTKAYSASDPGVLFNIYGGATSYPIPGPKVWDGASTGGSAPATPATPSTPSSAPSSPATPSKSAAPVASPVAEAEPAQPTPTGSQGSSPSPAPAAPSAGAGSGSALPESFTIEQFISWLKAQTGSSAKRMRRAHARAFQI